MCYNKLIKTKERTKRQNNPIDGACKGGESNQNLTLHPII